MSAVDDEVLTLLRAALTNVHDGHVKDSDGDAKTISAPLPYAIYYGKTATPIHPRVGGSGANRGNDVRVTCVGSTREQADWAADKVEAALHEAVVTGRQMRLDERVRPVRDDTWTRPDGGPLFSVALVLSV